MKKLFLSALFAIVCLSASPQDIVTAPKVDERAELLSIVFRLAGAKEYAPENIPTSYIKDIDTWFAPYLKHEVILYASQLREQYYIGYDAVMSYAVNIEIANGTPRFIKNRDNSSLEDRWQQEPAEQFLSLLDKFYKESKFHDFFVNQKPLYDVAEARFAEAFNSVDMGWYEKFYGAALTEKVGKLGCIISVANGPNNYGVSVLYKDGTLDARPVVSTWLKDSIGMPVYQIDDIRYLVVHEFNHPFCNPLIDKYYAQMETVAEEIFKPVEDAMRRRAYGNSKTMFYEMLVRACGIQYEQQVNSPSNSLREEIKSGFVWIPGLARLLDDYTANREKYPSLEDFMPEVVKYVNSLSPGDIPNIVSVNIASGSQDVDPGLKEIVIKFDRPMFTQMNGATYGKGGELQMPALTGSKWRNGNEWVLSVDLKPGTEYSISFPGFYFMSEDYVAGLNTYYLDFKTAE